MVSQNGNYRLFAEAYIALFAVTLLVTCSPELEPSSDTKHSSFNQANNPIKIWYLNRKILIKMVHEEKWRIGIKYDKELGYSEGQKKELEAAVKKALDMWLAPVRKYRKKYDGRDDVVGADDFEFIEIHPPRFRRYHTRRPRKPVDLEITFKGGFGLSHWKPKVISGVGMVRMFRGTGAFDFSSDKNNIPQNTYGYSWNTHAT